LFIATTALTGKHPSVTRDTALSDRALYKIGAIPAAGNFSFASCSWWRKLFLAAGISVVSQL
jgi:hypothetical protein